jgi:hypothetical protein
MKHALFPRLISTSDMIQRKDKKRDLLYKNLHRAEERKAVASSEKTRVTTSYKENRNKFLLTKISKRTMFTFTAPSPTVTLFLGSAASLILRTNTTKSDT